LRENMETLLVKYFRNESLTENEVKAILKEYIHLTGKNAGDVVEKVFSQISQNMNPIVHQLITTALSTSAHYLTQHYTITRVYSKEGQLLMVY